MSDYADIKFNLEEQQKQMQPAEGWTAWAAQGIFSTDFHAAQNLFRSMNGLDNKHDSESAIADIMKNDKDGNLSRRIGAVDSDGDGKNDTVVGVYEKNSAGNWEMVFDNPWNELDKSNKYAVKIAGK
jgi:hypothetical protein